MDKINEQFIIFNAKYDNLLKRGSNDYDEYIINENLKIILCLKLMKK